MSCTFDIGRRRKRQGETTTNECIQVPAASDVQEEVDHCLNLVRTEALYYDFQFPPETPGSLAEKLVSCPCTKYQADEDVARFLKLGDSSRNCYISAQPVAMDLIAFERINLTQMCCYDDN